MKHFITSVMALVLVAGSFAVVRNSWYGKDNSNPSRIQSSKNDSLEKTSPYSGVVEQSIFIPYWNIPTAASDISEYDTLIYFGILPDENGELVHDSGFMNLKSFIQNTPSDTKRLLTVRMLDTEDNLAILGDVSRQSSVVSQTLEIAEEHGFDGIVLDLEIGVLPLGSVEKQITSFVKDFSGEAHENRFTFSITMYGDTFYRVRSFDVESLGQYVDQIYIMAYDFHKSRGEPGPNFPFDRENKPPHSPLLGKEGNGRGGYGYDFKTMIANFTEVVPREKLTILFGMYGYDWTLGPKGLPLKAAKAIPLNEIEQEYKNCQHTVISTEVNEENGVEKSLQKRDSSALLGMTKCKVIRDSVSKEKHITYTDDEGYDHVLWYEDHQSVAVKKQYLKEQGIGSIGYWVWGYFN